MNEGTPGPVSRPPSPEVLAALRELRAEYGLVLPGLIRKLAEALSLAKSCPEDPSTLENVRGQAHKLRGSAGSYGFSDVGIAAARIEDAAVSIQNALTAATPESWAEMDQAIHEMDDAAKRAIESLEREAV